MARIGPDSDVMIVNGGNIAFFGFAQKLSLGRSGSPLHELALPPAPPEPAAPVPAPEEVGCAPPLPAPPAPPVPLLPHAENALAPAATTIADHCQGFMRTSRNPSRR